MKCEKYSAQISSYIDNELSARDLTDLENHITGCASCQAEVQLLREIIKDINNLQQVKIPDTFHQDLMDKIKSVPNPKVSKNNKQWFLNWKVGSGVAAAAILVFLIFKPLNLNYPERLISPNDAIEPRVANYMIDEDYFVTECKIETRNFEEARREIIKIIEKLECQQRLIKDTRSEEINNREYIVEVVVNKKHKDILVSQISEACKEDMLEWQNDDKELESGLDLTIVIQLNEIR